MKQVIPAILLLALMTACTTTPTKTASNQQQIKHNQQQLADHERMVFAHQGDRQATHTLQNTNTMQHQMDCQHSSGLPGC